LIAYFLLNKDFLTKGIYFFNFIKSNIKLISLSLLCKKVSG